MGHVGLQPAALPAPEARGPGRLRLSGGEEGKAGKATGCGEGNGKAGGTRRGAARRSAGAVWPPHRRRPAPFGGCSICGSGCRCQLGGCVPTWRRRQRGRPRGALPRRADGNTDDGPETRLHLYHGESRGRPGAQGPRRREQPRLRAEGFRRAPPRPGAVRISQSN